MCELQRLESTEPRSRPSHAPPPHAPLHFPQADKETRHKCEHCDLIGASQFASLLNPRGELWHNDYSVNLRRVAGHPLPPAGSARGAVICYQHAPSNNLVISWHERQTRVCAQPLIYWRPLSFSERGQRSHDARCGPDDCNCLFPTVQKGEICLDKRRLCSEL